MDCSEMVPKISYIVIDEKENSIYCHGYLELSFYLEWLFLIVLTLFDMGFFASEMQILRLQDM